MPKVSVIVPIYNVEIYLARCLDSLINQTLEDIEIICVNDGSTDNSTQILEDYAKKDNRIKIITQVNSGLSEARNTGVRNSSGDYIGFVDSDDYVDSDYFEKLYIAASDNNADIACAGIIREGKKYKKVFLEYKSIETANSFKGKCELVNGVNHSYAWDKIYKRESLISNNLEFIRGMLFEDRPFVADAYEKMGTLVTVPGVYYHYWINQNSIVKTPTDRSRADKLFSQKYFIDKCKKYAVKLSEKNGLYCKREYYLLGIRILKVYEYDATKVYSLFGILPILKMREYV